MYFNLGLEIVEYKQYMALTLLYVFHVGKMHQEGTMSSKLFGSADQHNVLGKQNVFTLFQGEKYKHK